MAIYLPAQPASGPPSPEHAEAMGKFMEEMERAGVLLGGGGFGAHAAGLRIRATNGECSVLEGLPEALTQRAAGFALLELKTREEAIEVSKRFLRVAGDGVSELYPLMDAPPEPPAQR